MITIKGPQSEILPQGLGGPNPPKPIRDWFEYAKGQRGVESYTDGAMQVLTVPHDKVTTAGLMLCLSEGFEVHNAPWFIVMDADTYAGEVPDGISNRTIETDDGETIRTWADWHSPTHNHMDAADGRKIVAGASWGVELTSDEIVVLLGAGYTLVLGADVSALLPDDDGGV